MSKVLIEEQTLYDIGDAIRDSLHVPSSNVYKPSQMAEKINEIADAAAAEITGGYTGVFLSGTDEPTPDIGSNKDVYLLLDSRTKIDYMESAGGPFFVTDYFINKNTRVVMDLELPAPYNSYDTPFGVRESGLGDFFVAYNGGILRYICGDKSGNVINVSSYYGQRVQLILSTTRCAIEQNGTVLGEVTFNSNFSASNSAFTIPLAVFVLGTSAATGQSRTEAKGKLYSFCIYEGDTLVRHYEPCINDDDVIYAHDTIRGTDSYNRGSGNFTCSAGESGQEVAVDSVNAIYIKLSDMWRNFIGLDYTLINE